MTTETQSSTWRIEAEPVGRNPGDTPRDDSEEQGNNEGGMVVYLSADHGGRHEIARVAFDRTASDNPDVSFHEQLDDVMARARKALEVLDGLTSPQGTLL